MSDQPIASIDNDTERAPCLKCGGRVVLHDDGVDVLTFVCLACPLAAPVKIGGGPLKSREAAVAWWNEPATKRGMDS